VPDPTLFLFDGFNLLHAGEFTDVRELTDVLASFVAMQGARGIVVFDGVGDDAVIGPLEIRFAAHADTLLERLAAQHRDGEHVRLISSDAAVRGTAGQQVSKLSSKTFLRDITAPEHREQPRSRVEDSLDDETRARLERLRRGQSS
jgi:predicted RNA-binding protein with PIN domain